MPGFDLRLIVGLGNPGAEHEHDRHNVGFRFVDELAAFAGARLQPDKKAHGESGRVAIAGVDVRLLKPMTYMNLSGQSVQAVTSYLRIPPANVLVVHDELDFAAGEVRLKSGGGPGGHNGLRDIIRHLGRDFLRLRIGVGHPGLASEVTNYVLRRATIAEEREVEAAMQDALRALPVLVNDGLEKATHKLHSRNITTTPGPGPLRGE